MKNYSILIRHGESESNVKGIVSVDVSAFPLTENGKLQVKKSAEYTRKMNIDHVFSSPVLRARQTSEIISEASGMDYAVDERLNETGVGRFNNSRITEETIANNPEEFEDYEDVKKRMLSILEEKRGNTVFVSHGTPIKAVISSILGIGQKESDGIIIRNASITIVNLEESRILCIGSMGISPRIIEELNQDSRSLHQ